MFDKLKYIALSMTLMVLVSACSSSTSDEPNDAFEMKFAAREASDSRAALTTGTTIKEKPFAVYGDMVSTTNPAATPTVIFNNTPVKYTNSAWSYDNIQYWFPGSTYSFIALHPQSAVETLTPTYSNSTLSFTYTQPDDYRATTDLLVASHRRNYTVKGSDPVKTVAFNFAHILSRINFVAEVKNSQQNPIIIESMSLRNVHKSATYTIMPASIISNNETDDYVGGWTDYIDVPAEGNQLFKFPMVETTIFKIEPGNDRAFFPSNSNPLFVIPQQIPEEMELVIEYRAESAGSEIITVSALLYPASLQHGGEWLAGKSYTYNFDIGVDTDIIFNTPTVDDWVESLGGNYIIPD